ncbi:cell division protein FtsQ/DivIB [Jatrophihabitans fulvus]
MTSTQWRPARSGPDDWDEPTLSGDPSDDERPARVSAPARRRRRVALWVALGVVVALFGTWLVAFSPVFGVRGVEVHGARTLTATTVERAAQVDYGQPLVRVDTAAMAARVEAVPQVESVQVSTSFPSTLVITVRERTPVGYVAVAGRALLVDRTGVRYPPVAGERTAMPTGLPELGLTTGTSAAAKATARAVAEVAAALPAALRARVRTVQALDANSVTVLFRGGLLVRWGSAARSAQKATVVAVLEDRRPQQQVIDVSDPDRPVTR